jgi:lyso-ornithine lipid O-acyltransferase
MAYVRAFSLSMIVFFFYAVVAPLQWLALRRGWAFSRQIPALFHRCLLAVMRIKVEIHGRPADVTPKLIIANHVSWTDICTLSTFAPVCFLSKKEVGTWPIISTFARLQRTVFVDREQPKSIVGANAQMVDRMDQGVGVVLFPEGTTFDGSMLGHFHSSHFAAPRDYLRRHPESGSFFVQPVAIRYSHKHVAWYGDASLLPHLMALLAGPSVRCDLYVCDPIVMTKTSDRKAIADRCNKAIEAMLVLHPNAAEPAAP